jgi:hypothetical protein
MILHSMQSTILDDKSSPRAYPRDEIAAQARCAERLNHVGFVRHLTDFLKYVNYEMPAEEARVILPPPGVFQSPDRYSRKRWRRVQHLANEFWSRWRREFLLSLQRGRSGASHARICVLVILSSSRNQIYQGIYGNSPALLERIKARMDMCVPWCWPWQTVL